MNNSLFFSTCSTLLGSLTTIAGGSEGTDISKVPKPTFGWTSANQSKSLWRGCRNQIPLPARGRVPGGRLDVVGQYLALAEMPCQPLRQSLPISSDLRSLPLEEPQCYQQKERHYDAYHFFPLLFLSSIYQVEILPHFVHKQGRFGPGLCAATSYLGRSMTK